MATEVGKLEGIVGVNQYGAATYTLPIEVPQGVNGLQPNISISYNSMVGNGLLGEGFSIQGLSSITRTPKTIYYDGYSGGLNEGAFVLDGERLIESSSTEYTLENDAQVKIKKIVNGASFYFEVLMPDGRKFTYGKSSTCRSVADFAWYIERIEDAYGNYLTYTYFTSENIHYLSKIEYGKNSKSSNSLSCVVIFAYQSRPDIITSYTRQTL